MNPEDSPSIEITRDQLARAADVRQVLSGKRRWASKRRKKIEAIAPYILQAVERGLSKQHIRNLLQERNIKVGRWMMDDIVEHIKKASPQERERLSARIVEPTDQP